MYLGLRRKDKPTWMRNWLSFYLTGNPFQPFCTRKLLKDFNFVLAMESFITRRLVGSIDIALLIMYPGGKLM